jgi:PHD/YefM family antitoxin component YafN of YafNO toxin-antitoxin module
MPQIIPIRDLRNTTEISNLCHQSSEPVFVTKNGYGDLVIMSMEAYEQRLAVLDVYNKLVETESDLNQGKLMNGDDALKQLRQKYVK